MFKRRNKNETDTEPEKPLVKQISLCIWGDGPGRPYDNIYTLVRKEMNEAENLLTLYFDENEKCTVFNPSGVEWDGMRFKVETADKIIWQFYYYGKPQTSETLIQLEYTFIDKKHVHVIEKGYLVNQHILPAIDKIFNPHGKIAIDTT